MTSGGTYDSLSYEITTANGKKIVRSLHDQVAAFASNVRNLALYGQYDVIHAHDWLTLQAGIEAKRVTGLPLFVHIHATEYDRAGAAHGNPIIRDIEYIGMRSLKNGRRLSDKSSNGLGAIGFPLAKYVVD